MAEKLTEAAWTSLTKKLKVDLDDTALTKALARCGKASDPAALQAALGEAVEQIRKQSAALAKRKKEIGDKPFQELSGKLDTLLASAEREQKEAAAQAHAQSDADTEEDSPALLTTRMVPLLRELRKGEVRMPALICTAGKAAAVLIRRKPIATSMRKLLADTLDAQGGAKFIPGEALFENGALTFVVPKIVGGMAKSIRLALLQQTELRLKVRVRGEDGSEDDDGDEGNDPAAEAETAAAAASATPPIAPPAAGAVEAQTAFNARLAALAPLIKARLAAGDAAAAQIKSRAAAAGDRARSRDYEGAHAELDELEVLLAPPGRADEAGFEAAMQRWKRQRQNALDTLRLVAREVAAAKHTSSAQALLELNAVMKQLTEAPASRQQVTELKRYLQQDDVVQDVCELARDIRKPLLGALDALGASL